MPCSPCAALLYISLWRAPTSSRRRRRSFRPPEVWFDLPRRIHIGFQDFVGNLRLVLDACRLVSPGVRRARHAVTYLLEGLDKLL